jgi:hypothetical protein
MGRQPKVTPGSDRSSDDSEEDEALSDEDDDRPAVMEDEATADIYRNSALGM